MYIYYCTDVLLYIKYRFRRQYTLLGGLWCANEQPPIFQYLQPILERCKQLETEGTLCISIAIPLCTEESLVIWSVLVLIYYVQLCICAAIAGEKAIPHVCLYSIAR